MSAQLAHCTLERKRAYTSHTAYKSSTVYSWYAGDRASLLCFIFLIKAKKEKKHFSQWIWIILNENPYFFKNKNKTYFVLGLFSKNIKKGRKEKKKQCREWVNTLMYGSPVLETYWSWTIRYQAWTLFRGGRGRSFRSVGKVCNTRQPQWLHH